MASSDTPMLFIPPLPPFALPGEGAVTLGRSSSCELRLHDVDTSRRHAEILCDASGCRIRDLASTNGTFVNGERVEECGLEPGDRIQVGTNTLTFCRVESAVPSGEGAFSAGDDKTVFTERPVASQAFQGDLAEIPPFAVLQILEMGRKTGVLKIEADTEPGSLWLQRGDPIHAETKGQLGFDAALRLVCAKRGRFAFEPAEEPPEATIEASVTELLMEAARQLDEGRL
jgi:pSer/pThr/pTyr-binding forkhead associated (FHA) protein